MSELAHRLRTGAAPARVEAARLLARDAAAAAACAADLVSAAAADDEELREWATAALEDCGPPAVDQWDALAQLAAGGNADSAYWAVTLLGRAGAAAATHLPALRTIAERHAAATVRKRAQWAVERMEGK